MKLRYLSIIVVIATVVLSFMDQKNVFSDSNKPPVARTGAPSETTCNTSGCHTGSAVVTNSSTIVFSTIGNSFSTGYTAGTIYNITITFNANTARKGFEITALDASNVAAGTLALGNGSSANSESLQTSGGRQYLGHNSASSISAWTFKWTAPAISTGPVTFYVAANAANNNNDPSGDVIHTDTFMVYPAGSAGCTNFAASISGNTSICPGTSTTLTASSTGGTGTNTYLWSDHTTNASISASGGVGYRCCCGSGA